VTKILIVGAGPSGLAALKEMREAGFDAVAVDERASFGGVFAPDSGVTFEGLHLTISSIFMSFSDFPAPDVHKGVKFWSQREYWEYLAKYVEHFDLAPHIRLETRVAGAHYDHVRKKWQVSMTDRSHPDGVATTPVEFDKLIVASGANHTPYTLCGFEDFRGQLLHSADYHSPEQVRGKRVLVIGTGEGASDVANSATSTAASVTVWGRSFPDFAPRFIRAYVDDPDYDEERNLPLHHRPNELLEHVTITRSVRTLPLAVWSIGLQGLTKDMHAKYGPDSLQGVIRGFVSHAWGADFYSSDTSVVPTKSAVVATSAARGLLDIVIAPQATVDGQRVSFVGAKVFGAGGNGAPAAPRDHERLDAEFDVVVACTGFGLDFDWISTSDATTSLTTNPRTWFKHCFPPGMGEHLAFVGFARPHSGGIPQCSEMVSRYIAQIYLGNRSLPANYAELAIAEGKAEAACFHQRPNYHMLVDYMAYMMSVAKLVGCVPRALPPLSAPMDAVKYWTFPLWPAFFRTQGVGAKPEAAAAVIDRFGTWDALPPMPLLAIEIVFGFVMPFVNAFSLVVGSIFPRTGRRALPWLYKWRMSKMHFLYDNSLTWRDFKTVPTQWLAALLVLVHVVTRGVQSPEPMAKQEQAIG